MIFKNWKTERLENINCSIGMAMKKDEIGARLRSERERAGLSRDQVIAHISYSRSTLQQWEAGHTEPPISAIEQLASLYKISSQYLIFGEQSDTPVAYSTVSANDEDYKDISIYDLAAGAGTGRLVADENIKRRLKFPNWWFNERGLQHTDVAGLYTKGDSMEPTIPDNSLLLIDQSQTYLSDGKVYVVRVDDELYVKRIKRILGGGLELISDNPDYRTKVLEKEDLRAENFFQVIGQVVHIGIDLPH